MKTHLLIGDSGGSGTGWCYIDREGNEHYFETPSYHPVVFSSRFFQQMERYWKEHPAYHGAQISFYGAGCSQQRNQEMLRAHFEKSGFQVKTINSDAAGCCEAYFGNEPGILVILGTGSVCMHYDGRNIVKQEGGLGYLLGDEGSGFYFGKLLVQRWLNGELSQELVHLLETEILSRALLLPTVYGNDGRHWIAGLAKRLANHTQDFSELRALHTQNIGLFFTKHLVKQSFLGKKIVFVGSYAAAQQDLIMAAMEANKPDKLLIEANPIRKLTAMVASKNE